MYSRRSTETYRYIKVCMDYIECLSILLQLDSVVNESTYLLSLDQFKLTSFF